MNAPATIHSPPSSRETELARAEAELASQEARLAEQLTRAATESEALARRVTELRQEVARLPSERQGEDVRTVSSRLQAAAQHTDSTEDARERALAARHEALETRLRIKQETQAALELLQRLNTQARQELSGAESELKHVAEAAAKAQREREAAAKREATQARQAALQARQAALAQGNVTIPEPNPLGARLSRVRMQAMIDLRSDSNFFTGFSTDIHEGGVFVATVQTVPRGTTVDLDLTLPGGRPMKVSGVVRWTREVNDKTPELMPGLGVGFTQLQPEVADAISDFVATREPMFFPD